MKAIAVKYINNATPPMNENDVKGTYEDAISGEIRKCVLVANVGTESLTLSDSPNSNQAIYTDSNGKRHKVLLVADVSTLIPQYTATVTFDVDWVSCDGDDFLAFLQDITARYPEAKSGMMVYDASSNLWTTTVYDKDSEEIVEYKLYHEDMEEYGFTFTKEPEDADIAEFTCSITIKE